LIAFCTVTTPQSEPKVWSLLYGPCFCHAYPGSEESFDFLRFRTYKFEGNLLRVNVVVVSDRVIYGSMATYRTLLDRVQSPRLVFAAGPCPMASRFWDALPVGWTPASEVVQLDGHIPECIRGNPEVLVARVLAGQSGRSRAAEAV